MQKDLHVLRLRHNPQSRPRPIPENLIKGQLGHHKSNSMAACLQCRPSQPKGGPDRADHAKM